MAPIKMTARAITTAPLLWRLISLTMYSALDARVEAPEIELDGRAVIGMLVCVLNGRSVGGISVSAKAPSDPVNRSGAIDRSSSV